MNQTTNSTISRERWKWGTGKYRTGKCGTNDVKYEWPKMRNRHQFYMWVSGAINSGGTRLGLQLPGRALRALAL